MKNWILNILIAALLASTSLNAKAQIVPKPLKHPKVVVVKTARPGNRYYWRPSEWEFHDGAYVWGLGGWEVRLHKKLWMKGYWKKVEKGYEWVPGKWI